MEETKIREVARMVQVHTAKRKELGPELTFRAVVFLVLSLKRFFRGRKEISPKIRRRQPEES